MKNRVFTSTLFIADSSFLQEKQINTMNIPGTNTQHCSQRLKDKYRKFYVKIIGNSLLLDEMGRGSDALLEV
jgi:hypothetical protein